MTISARIEKIDFDAVRGRLNETGWRRIPSLLTVQECKDVCALYAEDDQFRSTVTMNRHGFGQGEYRYFSYPLPALVTELRQSLFPSLSQIANEWNETLGKSERYPKRHETYRDQCAAAGQSRPTPLILRYSAGDYNCLHQDIYGDELFPLQAAILLSDPGADFDGGEFVLTEQRPRMQSRPYVAALSQGDAVIFAVNERPKIGARGPYRVKMRHGVSEITRGHRYTLGVIFHDAA